MIKQQRKRYSLLLAAAVLLCGLTACGKDKSGVYVLEDLNTQPEYINFFSNQSMLGSDVSKYWADHFTERYNKQVYINIDSAAYYDDEGLSYRELLEKRLESSAPDDLYIINAEDVLEFGKKGYWMDLSGMDFVDNLSDAALYQSTYNGKVFSVPLSFTGFGFLWNLDLLKEHDLAIPQNLEEFLNVCEALKENGILPYGANKGFALTVPVMCVGLSNLYGSSEQHEKIVSLNKGETQISDYLREGFEFLSLMLEKGYMDAQQALAATPRVEDVELFLAGECAFICAGLGDCYGFEGIAFQIENTGLPVLQEGSVTVYGADNRLCVNPNSRHLETALEFIEMVGTPEALTESAALAGTMSSAKGAAAAQYPGEGKLVELLGQPGQIPNQDFSLHFNTWESIRDVCREICGGIGIDRACSMLDEKQRTELEAYGENIHKPF